MTDPLHLQLARKELGQREVAGPKSNPTIMAYRKEAGVALDGEDGSVPWCAIFIYAMLKRAGLKVKGRATARSFVANPEFKQLAGPALGCIVVLWRGSPTGPFGHVFFGTSETSTFITGIGGNQGDSVSESRFPKARVLGYYWPAALPLPEIKIPVSGVAAALTNGNEA